MGRSGLCRTVLAACLLAPAGVMAFAAPSPAAAEEGSDKAGVDSAYVKVTLTRDDQSFAHPGFRLLIDEEGAFVINCGGKDHEVVVTILEASETDFKLSLAYSINGKEQLRQELDAAVGAPIEVRKGKTVLAIELDPQGQKDISREDEDQIIGPDTDDPLGGM